MKLGFLSASLASVPLEELVPWAAASGFQAIELAAWRAPRHDREYAPRHVKAERITADDAARIRDLVGEHGLTISSLAYYDNNMHPDAAQRKAARSHLRKVVDAAALLGVDRVGTFVGGRPVRAATVIKDAGRYFRRLCHYAADRGVKIMIENCPMENWVRFGLPGNFAYSPELWEALFEEVPDANFGLNIDPSHLYWLGIDYVRAVHEFRGRIFHAHAKDAEILREGRYRHGVLAEQLGDNPWHSGWWRYRLPGHGEIDWTAFVTALHLAGYDDVLSIEHEDPEYEGSTDRVMEGLRRGKEYLSGLMR